MAFRPSSAIQRSIGDTGAVVAEEACIRPDRTAFAEPLQPVRTARCLAAIATIWFVVALLSSFQGYMSGIAHDNPQPWLPAFGYALVWYGGWAAVTPIVVVMARRFGPEGRSRAVFVLLQLAGALVTAVLHSAIFAALTVAIYGPEPGSPSSFELVFRRLASHGHAYVLLYFVIVGIVLGIRAYRALRDSEVDAAHLETRLAEAETAALRAQLQPHFLFNTLNAISAVVPDDPIMAQRLIARLGDLLRLSIDQHRGQRSSLAEELEFTDVYLAIEQVRLGGRLRIQRNIAAETLNATVPTLLLQPLAENAVRHGLSPQVAGGTLTIEAAIEGAKLRITVADDGKGAAKVVDGVGLGNARARLQQLYGDRQSLEIETAAGKGFKVTVTVPR